MLPSRYVRLVITFRPLGPQTRSYRSSAYDRSCSHERVTVPCRGNGSIALESVEHNSESIIVTLIPSSIYNSPSTAKTKPRASKPPSLVITLPSSADPAHNDPLDEVFSAVLAELSGLAVVQLNYRPPPEHHFPKPLHDVLAGYDWIVKHLIPTPPAAKLPSYPERLRSSREPSPPVPDTVSQSRVGVFGSYIGGSLALALGLTECRTATSLETLSSYPARIAAIATHNAVSDWLAPYQALPSPAEISNEANLEKTRTDRQRLLTLSRTYFHTHRPIDTLDPFASPTYFFRTPAISTPPDPSTSAQMDSHGHSRTEPWMNLMVQPTHTGLNFFSSEFKNRSYHRGFPPVSMGPCTLPDMLLGVEKVGGELWSQNEALGRCVRRAMARQMMPVKAGARAREVEEEYMDEEEARVVRKRELKERGEELRDLIEKMSGRVRVEALKGGNGGGKMEDGEVQKLAEFFAEKLAGDE